MWLPFISALYRQRNDYTRLFFSAYLRQMEQINLPKFQVFWNFLSYSQKSLSFSQKSLSFSQKFLSFHKNPPLFCKISAFSFKKTLNFHKILKISQYFLLFLKIKSNSNVYPCFLITYFQRISKIYRKTVFLSFLEFFHEILEFLWKFSLSFFSPGRKKAWFFLKLFESSWKALS